MEGYAAESVSANRKILRKRSFRNIDRKAPKAKKRKVKDAVKERQQALKMNQIVRRKDIQLALTLGGLFLIGISGIVYLLSSWI